MQFNLHDDEAWVEGVGRAPRRDGYRWRRKRLAGDGLGASLYELPPGESTFPYHYELGNDELVVVASGHPTLRTPDGERRLEPGDTVLFTTGPGGAHKLTNDTNGTVRVLVVSTMVVPRAAVHVDSGKMMIRWGTGTDESRWFRIADDVEYWDGEA